MSYLDKIVLKPWGYEFCQTDDGRVAIWLLHIRAGHATSRHYHERKHTSLVLLSGNVRVLCRGSTLLWPAQCVSVPPLEQHSTCAIEDSWIMEIESPSDKNDLVRLGDDYGRVGHRYEDGNRVVRFDERAAFPASFDEVLWLGAW